MSSKLYLTAILVCLLCAAARPAQAFEQRCYHGSSPNPLAPNPTLYQRADVTAAESLIFSAVFQQNEETDGAVLVGGEPFSLPLSFGEAATAYNVFRWPPHPGNWTLLANAQMLGLVFIPPSGWYFIGWPIPPAECTATGPVG